MTDEQHSLLVEFKLIATPRVMELFGMYPRPDWTLIEWDESALKAAERWLEAGKPVFEK